MKLARNRQLPRCLEVCVAATATSNAPCALRSSVKVGQHPLPSVGKLGGLVITSHTHAVLPRLVPPPPPPTPKRLEVIITHKHTVVGDLVSPPPFTVVGGIVTFVQTSPASGVGVALYRYSGI